MNSHGADGPLPLEGVRVLEVGGGIAAAFAGHELAGFGAEVVRAELPVRVPLTRHEEVYLVAGKRRVEVDAAQLRALALEADIVVEDRRPGELAALGLAPADLRTAKPELVVVSMTPFGQDGPYAQFETTNIVSFAMGGIMSVTGSPYHPPLVTGGSQAQYLGGLNGAAAAVTAYLGRVLGGEGDWVDISLQECAVANMELYASGTAYGDQVQLRMGNQVRPVWSIYPCGDRWAGVFCLQRQIPALFEVVGDPELDDPRFIDPLRRLEHAEELTAKLYVFFAEHEPAEILELGARHHVPFGVALTPRDLLEVDGLAARDYFEDLATPEGPARVPGRPFPGLGWHQGDLHEAGADTDAVLADWLGAAAERRGR